MKINEKISNLKQFFSKNKNILSYALSIIIGLISFFIFNNYIVLCYVSIYIIISILMNYNKKFNYVIKTIKQDQLTIKKHYLGDFKIAYLLVLTIKIVSFFFLLYYFMLLDQSSQIKFGNVFFFVFCIFSLGLIIDLLITSYIIQFKNDPVKFKLFAHCINCTGKLAIFTYGIHVSSQMPMLPATPLSNFYNYYSPLSGVKCRLYSNWQIIHLEALKSSLGSDFDLNQIVNGKTGYAEPNLISSYAKSKGIFLPNNKFFNIKS